MDTAREKLPCGVGDENFFFAHTPDPIRKKIKSMKTRKEYPDKRS